MISLETPQGFAHTLRLYKRISQFEGVLPRPAVLPSSFEGRTPAPPILEGVRYENRPASTTRRLFLYPFTLSHSGTGKLRSPVVLFGEKE